MGSVSMESVSSSRGERLSAFVDGEFEGHSSAGEGGFAQFDHEARATWSAYHLIGDVLRSDDLARSPAASQSFMASFAARLEAEPHLLAPAALATGRAGAGQFGRLLALRHRFVPTLAVAAAAAMLTWIVVPQMRGAGGAGSGVQVASVAPSSGGVRRVALNAVPAVPAAAQDGNFIRDARLDAYLEAHQQFAQQPMMADSMPVLRSAALVTQH